MMESPSLAPLFWIFLILCSAFFLVAIDRPGSVNVVISVLGLSVSITFGDPVWSSPSVVSSKMVSRKILFTTECVFYIKIILQFL